ncbi:MULTISPECIES: glyoxylate/hydroxypyruvate reductase A [Rhodopseudomonas]|uniref:Hydroxyacid dehydrogenase n=1 Tax=Rhodopseudomonas palustris TaxID=1076 RepID=A0A0D7ETB5_RHOPL|nr:MULTISPECIES: glyoxylate/hydroxypyruvate reductase A [Rhodopseudomonas]KIZ44079.1 hydroxyacid dehydrogenase [Rhodopseudomonas palustris]MDF3812409.1 glyoxylate/hydroxypyruvate reductase A [Rhodopseudomonas sp. BAL398]WOK17256.1 glyoxylate/hydroxypyruvate reductase A [Rhodopseudomonas sp. BAL398]
MHCVLLSTTVDLRRYLADQIKRLEGQVSFVDHLDGTDPAAIRMAVSWQPAADAFDHYPNLQAACSIGAGADSILRCPSLRDGIAVVRVVEPAQAQMMSGFVIWHAIWHQRGFATYLAHQRDRLWQRMGQRTAQEVPVGILGYGAIGARVAADLAALGFPVKVWSRSAKATPPGIAGYHGADGLDAMVEDTEILVNLLPLTPATRNILNGALFSRMRRGGYLIQVGRGEHLVEQDLLDALDSGQLAGAGLDVFLAEPLPPAHPFWSHPGIVLTPHDACDVSMAAIGETVLATAAALQAGLMPKDAVDRQLGY